MKPLNLILILLVISLCSCENCFEQDEKPDLYWNDYQYIQNPCTGQTEYLNVSRFFWVYNLNNPNYPPIVWLYYRESEQTFNDCFGIPWFIIPGSQMTSNRYMVNKSDGSTAKSPSARTFVTVKDAVGNETKTEGDVQSFPDLSPGEAIAVETRIEIAKDGSTYLTELVADPLEVIDESDESNNGLSDGFSRSEGAKALPFKVNIPDESELAKIKTRYIIYRNGVLEIRN